MNFELWMMIVDFGVPTLLGFVEGELPFAFCNSRAKLCKGKAKLTLCRYKWEKCPQQAARLARI